MWEVMAKRGDDEGLGAVVAYRDGGGVGFGGCALGGGEGVKDVTGQKGGALDCEEGGGVFVGVRWRGGHFGERGWWSGGEGGEGRGSSRGRIEV